MDPRLEHDELLRGVPTAAGCKFLEPVLLLDRIGRGGMGAVYLGFHVNLKCHVAVKCMLPARGGDGDHARLVERFQEEARLAADIASPHLVRVLDVLHRHDLHYLVMEFVDGETLEERVLRLRGPLPVAQAAAIAYFASLGLAAAHQNGVVHRDVKPANVLVTPAGGVKLLDLGIAKSRAGEADAAATLAHQLMGTPQYMAPELFAGAVRATPASDVYAMAATLGFLLTGEHLIGGGGLATIARNVCSGFPDVAALRPDLPRPLADLIARATALDIALRPVDASAFAAALSAALGAEPSAEALVDPECARAARAARAARLPARERLLELADAVRRERGGRTTAAPRTLADAPVPATRAECATATPRRWRLAVAAVAVAAAAAGFAIHAPRLLEPAAPPRLDAATALAANPPAAAPPPPLAEVRLPAPPEPPDPAPEVTAKIEPPASMPAPALAQPEPEAEPGPVEPAEVRLQAPPRQLERAAPPEDPLENPRAYFLELAGAGLGSVDARLAEFRSWFERTALPRVDPGAALAATPERAGWIVHLEFRGAATNPRGREFRCSGDFHLTVYEQCRGQRTLALGPERIATNAVATGAGRSAASAADGAFTDGLNVLRREAAALDEIAEILRGAAARE